MKFVLCLVFLIGISCAASSPDIFDAAGELLGNVVNTGLCIGFKIIGDGKVKNCDPDAEEPDQYKGPTFRDLLINKVTYRPV